MKDIRKHGHWEQNRSGCAEQKDPFWSHGKCPGCPKSLKTSLACGDAQPVLGYPSQGLVRAEVPSPAAPSSHSSPCMGHAPGCSGGLRSFPLRLHQLPPVPQKECSYWTENPIPISPTRNSGMEGAGWAPARTGQVQELPKGSLSALRWDLCQRPATSREAFVGLGMGSSTPCLNSKASI